jgi:mannose-6-phosphate isomerase
MMNQLYPLKFKPIFKDKIWGGRKIKTSLGMDFGKLPNCGEVWVISGVEGNPSVVENGFLAGNELNELIEVFMGDLVGDKIYDRFGDKFPLLIKFIDANDWLSIQVHPDDALAAKRGLGNGKTEMWYIMDANNNAELISGFSQKTDRESYLNHLENKTLKEILNVEKVKKGDVFYMPAGRVHAIGPGILLAEIQQTSDTTYRIYDWDRIDAAGMHRELHTEDALDAIDFSIPDEYKTKYESIKNQTSKVIDTAKFTTNIIDLDQVLKKNFVELDSFVIYIGLEGNTHLNWDEGQILLKQGEAIIKPAILNEIELLPDGNSKLLEVYIK